MPLERIPQLRNAAAADRDRLQDRDRPAFLRIYLNFRAHFHKLPMMEKGLRARSSCLQHHFQRSDRARRAFAVRLVDGENVGDFQQPPP